MQRMQQNGMQQNGVQQNGVQQNRVYEQQQLRLPATGSPGAGTRVLDPPTGRQGRPRPTGCQAGLARPEEEAPPRPSKPPHPARRRLPRSNGSLDSPIGA